MKRMYKIMLILFTILTTMGNATYATTTKLEIIDTEAETKYLDNNQGYISKKVIDSNEENGELTIELKLSNTTKEEQKELKTEVIFLVDNSSSMSTATARGITRKKMISNAIKTLTNQINSQSSNVYMGLVSFSATGNTICKLTNNKQNILSGISRFENSSVEGETNMIAGLNAANSSFSSDCKNRIIILLTDGTPSNDANGSTTKSTLLNVAKSGTYVISMVTETQSPIITNIFGTQSKPTTGKLYNIQETDIDNTMTQDIFKDVMEKTQTSIKDINIIDYFPTDIIENFDFSYVKKPSDGTISETININDRNIVWHIDELKSNESATVQYKLKLKDKYNPNLINKIIPTNEKVTLGYKDFNNKNNELVLDTSPKIKLTQEEPAKEETKPENTKPVIKDNTTKESILPKTGANFQVIILMVSTAAVAVLIWDLQRRYKNIKKARERIIK